MLNGHATKQTQ